MTIENFNQHIYSAQASSKKEEKVLFNDTDLRQSFVEFCRDHMEHENLARWSRSQSSDNLRFLKVVEVTPELGGIRFAEAIGRKFMEDSIQQLYFRDVQAWVNIDGVCDDVTQRAYVTVGNGYFAIHHVHLNMPAGTIFGLSLSEHLI